MLIENIFNIKPHKCDFGCDNNCNQEGYVSSYDVDFIIESLSNKELIKQINNLRHFCDFDCDNNCELNGMISYSDLFY